MYGSVHDPYGELTLKAVQRRQQELRDEAERERKARLARSRRPSTASARGLLVWRLRRVLERG